MLPQLSLKPHLSTSEPWSVARHVFQIIRVLWPHFTQTLWCRYTDDGSHDTRSHYGLILQPPVVLVWKHERHWPAFQAYRLDHLDQGHKTIYWPRAHWYTHTRVVIFKYLMRILELIPVQNTLDVCKYFFSQRITEPWNNLPAKIINFINLHSFRDSLNHVNLSCYVSF
jgi:hypothetical protein